MKHILLVLALATSVATTWAQDEAVIAVRSRLDRSNSIYLNLGAASDFGLNNYRGGTLFGAGYVKRINRIVGVGANISYASYKVDYLDYMTGKYDDEEWNNSQPNNFYYTADMKQYILVNLSGGDLKQLAIGGIVKINFVPIKSNTMASFYASIAPSLVASTLDKIESNINFFSHPSFAAYNQVNNDSFESVPKQTKWTGGAILSTGVEFFPASTFSFYIQAGLSYSFPVPFVDTSLHQTRILEVENFNPFDDYPLPENFPLSTEKGFTSFNFQLGLSYNF